MAPPGRHRFGRFTSTHAAAVETEKITRTGESSTDVRYVGGQVSEYVSAIVECGASSRKQAI